MSKYLWPCNSVICKAGTIKNERRRKEKAADRSRAKQMIYGRGNETGPILAAIYSPEESGSYEETSFEAAGSITAI